MSLVFWELRERSISFCLDFIMSLWKEGNSHIILMYTEFYQVEMELKIFQI